MKRQGRKTSGLDMQAEIDHLRRHDFDAVEMIYSIARVVNSCSRAEASTYMRMMSEAERNHRAGGGFRHSIVRWTHRIKVALSRNRDRRGCAW